MGDESSTTRVLSKEKGFCGMSQVIVERSWSGNLGPPTVNKAGPPPNPKRLKHQRTKSSSGEIDYKEQVAAAGIVPQLVRSGGLRRDWSFENLAQKAGDWKKKNQAPTRF